MVCKKDIISGILVKPCCLTLRIKSILCTITGYKFLLVYSASYIGGIILKKYYTQPLSFLGLFIVLAGYVLLRNYFNIKTSELLLVLIFISVFDFVHYMVAGFYWSSIGVFILAFTEELLYRFYLDAEISQLYSVNISSVVVTGLFVLAHVNFERLLPSYFTIIVFSIIFLLIKRKTNNIVICSGFHYLLNSFVILFIPLIL